MIGWGIWNFRATGEWQSLGIVAIGAIGLPILAGYLKWFLKKYSKLLSVVVASLGGAWIGSGVSDLWACAVCYKDPDSLVTQSAIVGVWFLLAVILTALVSIVLIARNWVKRARELNIQF